MSRLYVLSHYTEEFLGELSVSRKHSTPPPSFMLEIEGGTHEVQSDVSLLCINPLPLKVYFKFLIEFLALVRFMFDLFLETTLWVIHFHVGVWFKTKVVVEIQNIWCRLPNQLCFGYPQTILGAAGWQNVQFIQTFLSIFDHLITILSPTDERN